MSNEFGPLPAQIGDLVSVAGYGDRVFFVEAIRKIENIEEDGIYYEVVIDLACANTGEYLEADAEDLTFITDASQADAYLADKFPHPLDYVDDTPKPFDLFDITSLLNGGASGMKKPEPIKTARELSSIEASRRAALRKRKATLIDALLDQRNMYSELTTFFRGGYDGNLAQIEEDLSVIGSLDVADLAATTALTHVEKRVDMRLEHRSYE